MENKISIRKVAKSIQLTTRTLRYYEELGLITSIQEGRGNRFYERESLEKLIYLDELKNKGFSLKEIEEFMGDKCCNQKKDLFQVKIKKNQEQIEYLIWKNNRMKEEMEIVNKLNLSNFSIDTQDLENEYLFKIHETLDTRIDNNVEKIWKNKNYNIMEEKVYSLSSENFSLKNYHQYDFSLVDKKTENNFEIPKGKYIVAYSREGIEKQHLIFEKIADYITKNNLIIEGNLFVWNKFRIFCKKEKKIVLITKNIIKIKK
ncbi:MAG: MerR family transcriptional regulator [Fusobacteriaceae bacterium]